MPTEYPRTAREYLRQQRRWLRNIVIHSQRFDARDQIRPVLQSLFVGASMLGLPLFGLVFNPWFLIIWTVLLAHAFLSRLRYLNFSRRVLMHALQPSDIAWQGLLLLLDFIVWSKAAVDIVFYKGQNKW